MPDFSHLLKRPAGKTAKPKAIPTEIYPGIIEKFEYQETSNQKIPCLRLHLKLIGWPPSVSEADRMQEDADGNQIPIDLSKRPFRRDMMMPEDFTDRSWYYLDQFLRSCGLNVGDGADYELLIPQLTGQRVSVEIGPYINERTKEVGNSVGRVFGPVPVAP